MNQDSLFHKDAPVLVELYSTPGLQVASFSPAEIVEKSHQAIDSAMGSIYQMAQRINAMIESLAERPSKIEVTFGVKLTGESGALIAKAGAEANLDVKLTWESRDKSREQ